MASSQAMNAVIACRRSFRASGNESANKGRGVKMIAPDNHVEGAAKKATRLSPAPEPTVNLLPGWNLQRPNSSMWFLA